MAGTMGISDDEKKLVEQSHEAFRCDAEVYKPLADRQANALNCMIVTDSEEEDPDDYLQLGHLASPGAQALISKKRKAVYRRMHYLKGKIIVQRNFLGHKKKLSHKGNSEGVS